MNDLHELAICGESLIIVLSCCIINGLNGHSSSPSMQKKRLKIVELSTRKKRLDLVILNKVGGFFSAWFCGAQRSSSSLSSTDH